MSEKNFEYFRELDKLLLEQEELIAEQKAWLEHDMSDEQIALEGFKRVFDK